MCLDRTRGRKRILAPDGSKLTPPRHRQPDTTLVKPLARAWRWQRLLDRGVYALVSEIAQAERMSKSYVSRVLRLALLAPDIVEAILAGTTVPAVGFEQLQTGLPVSWEDPWRATSRGPNSVTALLEATASERLWPSVRWAAVPVDASKS
jgi:hypothetical protein